VVGKVGGDSGLTARGKQFADLLGDYMNSLKIENLLVWTSFFRRTIQTGRHVEGMHERQAKTQTDE
jgi:broad specificity phosphatase PhoE